MMSSPTRHWSWRSSILGGTDERERHLRPPIATPLSVLWWPSALLHVLVPVHPTVRDRIPNRADPDAITLKNP
jgi:hypothetical protein